jgi:hypothetical protein
MIVTRALIVIISVTQDLQERKEQIRDDNHILTRVPNSVVRSTVEESLAVFALA